VAAACYNVIVYMTAITCSEDQITAQFTLPFSCCKPCGTASELSLLSRVCRFGFVALLLKNERGVLLSILSCFWLVSVKFTIYK